MKSTNPYTNAPTWTSSQSAAAESGSPPSTPR